ncbi:MAG: hypothetical protein KDN19_17000 [Verrucomicrobiae bacterium]|nr:hypothetical protein [Verrucomicrobiae bacterium]
MKTSPHLRPAFFLIVSLALLLVAERADALHPQITKLHGKSSESRANSNFGSAVAVTERWIIVGDPNHGQKGFQAGAVHIFNVRNGRYVRRIYGDDTVAGDGFGSSVAVCGNRLLVGAPNRTESASFCGTAYLFDLVSGRQIAKLTPSSPAAFDFFGTSVAVSDDFAVVGAPGADGSTSDSGSVSVFDAKTGDPITFSTSGTLPNPPFKPADGASGDDFGAAVALCGHLLFVGAPNADASAGKVYLFDVTTGVRLRTRTNPGGANSARFGETVSTEGGLLVVGAPTDDEVAGGAGAAYLFDAYTGVQRIKFTDAAGQLGDRFGSAVCVSGGLILVGSEQAPGAASGTGAAFLYDAASGARLEELTAPDGKTNDFFGHAVAVCGNVAVIGASEAGDDVEPAQGAAYFYRPIGGPLPMQTLAKMRDFAPGTEEADFRILRDVGINPDGEAIFCAQLTGPGSGGGTDKGVWHTLEGPVDLAVKSRTDLSAVAIDFNNVRSTALFGPVMNQGNRGIFQSRLVGTGVNGTNNLAILQKQASLPVSSLLRTGTDITQLGDARIQIFREVLQNANVDAVTVSYLLRRGPGGITSIDDTGILSVNASGLVTDFSARENATIGTGASAVDLRQFFGRATAGRGNYATFGAYCSQASGGPSKQGLFYDQIGNSDDGVTALAMTLIPDATGEEFYRTFTGETNTSDTRSIYRAVLTGADVSGANNEGLWDEDGYYQIFRKGSGVADGPDPDGLGGDEPIRPLDENVVVNRILKFWPVGSNGSIALVKLRGPGVNASNDCALFFCDSTENVYVKLMREGDSVCDWDCPKIRNIQRVEVNPQDGRYAIVVGLTGGAARNQALFTGMARFGLLHTQSALRMPSMKLRKGTHYDSGYSQATTLRSILLDESTDRTGAGGKGLKQSLNNNGDLVLSLQFNNGAKELVIGNP